MKELEWSQHISHYKSMGIFPDAQAHLTHKSLVRFCRISNPSKLIWLSLFPARIKTNQSKMNNLEWSQDFPHYITLWELSVAMETRVLFRSGPKPNAANPPPQWFSRWNLITICHLVSEIFHVWKCGPEDRCRLKSHPISSSRAFGSGELKLCFG